jgi:hypothetical protein
VNQLEVSLAARAFRAGRAVRKASLRHRYLAGAPIAICLYQLGAEPFSAAAVGFGSDRHAMKLIVAGEPRNRDLAFSALQYYARWFNPKFEAFAAVRDVVTKGNWELTRARKAPQIIVANAATVEMIGRLGRRLAYLPTVGAHPADPELARLGQHFLFLHRHFGTPGQQLVVAMTDLLNEHWTTPQSPMERQSLAALNAYVEPPEGVHGYDAAAAAEKAAIGPLPSGEDDEKLEPLVEEFNSRRGASTAPSDITPFLAPIRAHYAPLVERTWDLLWTCRDRELAWPEAPSVRRRWDEDRQAYTDHIDWTTKVGRRRTRQTPRQAAMLMRRLEQASALVDAEGACDDPLLLIHDLLDGKAIQGTVVRVDETHRETVNVRAVCRPLITISSPDPCLMPQGKELWWTRLPGAAPYVIVDVQPGPSGNSLITLKLTTSSRTQLPEVGHEASFSIHTTKSHWQSTLPPSTPWTHRQRSSALPTPIDGE